MQYVPLQGLDLALYPKQDAAKSRPMHRLIHVFPIEADIFHYESSSRLLLATCPFLRTAIVLTADTLGFSS